MLFIFKPCVATFYVFSYVPYSPLGFFSPWDHFNAFTNGIARFKLKVFLGQWFIVAIIWFVLMNAHHHFFGFLIGPTLLSSSR